MTRRAVPMPPREGKHRHKRSELLFNLLALVPDKTVKNKSKATKNSVIGCRNLKVGELHEHRHRYAALAFFCRPVCDRYFSTGRP